MIKMWVNESLRFHFLFEKQVVRSAKVAFLKVVLCRAVAEKQMSPSAFLDVDYSGLLERM